MAINIMDPTARMHDRKELIDETTLKPILSKRFVMTLPIGTRHIIVTKFHLLNTGRPRAIQLYTA